MILAVLFGKGGHICDFPIHMYMIKGGRRCCPKHRLECKCRVAKFDPKVGSRRTTKIKSLVILAFILVTLVLLTYYMHVVLVLTLLFLLVRER